MAQIFLDWFFSSANTFGAVTVTYLIGALVSCTIFLLSARPSGVLPELRKLNWAPFALGAAIVGLEAGHVFLYRAGWKVSVGSLACNICLAVALLFVGYFFFREQITVLNEELIGYDATGRETASQFDEIVQKYEEFQEDAHPFFV